MRARGTQMGNYFWGCVLELCLLGISGPNRGIRTSPGGVRRPRWISASDIVAGAVSITSVQVGSSGTCLLDDPLW